MEKEFRIENYGVKHPKTRTIIEVERNISGCYAVVLTNQNTAVYSNRDSLCKKSLDTDTEKNSEKVFSRSSGTDARIATNDSIIALFNKEGKIRLVDYDGNRLSFIDTGNAPLRALAFLSSDVLCAGGESCKVFVYCIYDTSRLTELTYSDYVDSISSNGKYMAVSLASGELHIYEYAISDTGASGVVGRKKVKISVNEVADLYVEKSCIVQFINETQLFIGMCNGTGYIYCMEEKAITIASSMHSKGFTKAEVHGEYLITSSLDGRLRVSTHTLREVSSLYAGSSIQAFNALFSKSKDSHITGIQYIISTTTGNVLVYRDRWTPEPVTPVPVIQKSGPQNIREYNKQDTTETRTLSVHMQSDHKKGKFGRFMSTFQYRKALLAAIDLKNVETITSVMDYLHRIDRLLISVSSLTDENISVVAEISVDMLKIREFFDLANSVLVYCGNVLQSRESVEGNPIYEIIGRAVQEIEDEYLVQSVLAETTEYIKGLLTPSK
ncbi:hypothetical protein NEIG_00170 [Nematocida sp. ERTm5]|nr:hypothetical protein NEIRO02_1981 [Nematocida sp. AWRm79]KAI5185177.1 hypothetical protein NEIRO03_1953 [Nematocida sp. AWRm78]OAG30658.1 hypothetical protein NEIG_00170 [Nematocida sp. ERTm5]